MRAREAFVQQRLVAPAELDFQSCSFQTEHKTFFLIIFSYFYNQSRSYKSIIYRIKEI